MSNFSDALAAGRFLVTTEQTPPKGADLGPWLERLQPLRGHVDAVNLTESSGASMAMSPIGVVPGLIGLGLHPILQILCRDRNRIALQGDLLAASALGVTSVVATSGDPIEAGDHRESSPVFDLDTMELLRVAAMLNAGTDMMGNALRGSTDFTCGALVNPGAADLDQELRRMELKAEAGARFFQTQAVYTPRVLERFMAGAQRLGLPVLAGFIVVKSAEMGRRLNRSLPGVSIPDAMIGELAAAEDRRPASVEISGRLLAELRPLCQGLHVIAVGWEDLLPQILDAAGVERRARS